MNTPLRSTATSAVPTPRQQRRWAMPWALRSGQVALVAAVLGALVLGVTGWPLTDARRAARGQQPAVAEARPEFGNLQGLDDAAIRRAVRGGVNHLLSLQHADGSIHDRGHETTMTSLAIMAMASIGILPSDPSGEGIAMRRALDYVVNPSAPVRSPRQDSQGYFGRADGSRMYGHGITTLMLTEMLGMGADEQQDQYIAEALDGALRVTLAAQQVKKSPSNQGGWRYTPESTDSDLSVSVWHLMALRSAHNDGMAVPIEAIDAAVHYLEMSYTGAVDAEGKPRDVSGFSYTPGQNRPTFAMTAAGLLAMQVCGQYDAPIAHSAADWLFEQPLKLDERFFYYGAYYYAQAMHQRGGRHAQHAARELTRLLLAEQNSDGSWNSTQGEERNYGSAYATSLAVLSLSVSYHYLPIYQR